MNKEHLNKIFKKRVNKYYGENNLCDIAIDLSYDTVADLSKEQYESYDTCTWFFQLMESSNTSLDFRDNIEMLDYIKNNLEKFCNFYLDIEGANIEPKGIADIWFSFKLTEESIHIIYEWIDHLRVSQEFKNFKGELAEILDTLFVYHSDCMQYMNVTNIEVLN